MKEEIKIPEGYKRCIDCNKIKKKCYNNICKSCSNYRSIKKKMENMNKIPCECDNPNCSEMINPLTKTGDPARFAHGHNLGKKEKHYAWKGGRWKNSQKYWYVYKPEHPYCNSEGYIREHRLFLEQYLSKKYNREIYILPYFDVHNIDFNKNNNDPQNLMYIHRREHSALHNNRKKK
jgi:hypothetical protein